MKIWQAFWVFTIIYTETETLWTKGNQIQNGEVVEIKKNSIDNELCKNMKPLSKILKDIFNKKR